MNSGIFSKTMMINYSDVDSKNQVTNKGILRILQEVAGMHSSSLGYGVNDIPITGLAWIILNWKLKVFLRLKTHDSITINTWLRTENPLFTYRDFEILDKDGKIVAKATSKWVLYDVNKGSVIKIPEEVNNSFIYMDRYAFTEKINEKIKEPEELTLVKDYVVQRRDIDTNNHVNNLCYLDYAYEALPEEIYNGIAFSDIEIMYKHEAKLGENLCLYFSSNNDNEYIVTIKSKESQKLHAIIKLF